MYDHKDHVKHSGNDSDDGGDDGSGDGGGDNNGCGRAQHLLSFRLRVVSNNGGVLFCVQSVVIAHVWKGFRSKWPARHVRHHKQAPSRGSVDERKSAAFT